jgi:NAD(P)-dependent dehydrogenase (short-subunit alcohol dehydrogenase family)
LQHAPQENIYLRGSAMGSTYGTAVIAGASSILGMACANHLANEGYDLFLIDRNRHRLNVQANDLATRTQCAVEVYEADLRSPAHVLLIVEKIRQDASISLILRIDTVLAVTRGSEMSAEDAHLHDALTRAAVDHLGKRCGGACIHRATVTVIAGVE